MKEKVLEFLEREPKFRERSNKDYGIAKLLQSSFLPLKELDSKMLAQALRDYATMDRIWRKLLEERPILRGKDYSKKEALEARKLDELGYYTGYERDIKVGKEIEDKI